MKELIGACGLVCSDCKAFLATQAGDATAVARIAVEWGTEHGGSFKPEDVWCDGCMTAGERKCSHVPSCTTRACVVRRGLENCGRCEDYPCADITAFFGVVPQARETLDAVRRAATS